MSDAAAQALNDAIERNCAVILLMPATGPGEALRTRFLGKSAAGVWIESPRRQQLLAESLHRSGRPVSVSFRSGEYLVAFTTTIRAYHPSYPLSPAATVEGICLAPPVDIRMTQRRAGYRARVALDADIKTLAWKIDEATAVEAPAVTPGAVCDLRDLSINGMGVILRSGKVPLPPLQLGDRLRLELSAPDRKLVVAGRVRQEPRRLPDGSLRIGLNFEGVDRTIEGRRTLSQIAQVVAELQRGEARRRRAG